MEQEGRFQAQTEANKHRPTAVTGQRNVNLLRRATLWTALAASLAACGVGGPDGSSSPSATPAAPPQSRTPSAVEIFTSNIFATPDPTMESVMTAYAPTMEAFTRAQDCDFDPGKPSWILKRGQFVDLFGFRITNPQTGGDDSGRDVDLLEFGSEDYPGVAGSFSLAPGRRVMYASSGICIEMLPRGELRVGPALVAPDPTMDALGTQAALTATANP